MRMTVGTSVFGFMFAALAHGQEASRVTVEPGVAAVHVDRALSKKFAEVCAHIGSSFVIGQGPLGLGIFTQAKCVESIGKAREAKEQYPWILSLSRDGEDEFVTKIYYQKISAQIPLLQLKTRRYRALDESVKNKAFLDIFAARAVLRLPMWGAERRKNIRAEPDWRSAEFATELDNGYIQKGTNFNVYTLTYAPRARLWRSGSLGALKEWNEEANKEGQSWVWYGSGDDLTLEMQQKLEKEYDLLVNPADTEAIQEKFMLKWKDYGLIGLRSGKQILMGDPLTDQLFLHELFFDSGPPLGIEGNLQFMPEVQASSGVKKMSVMTAILGKSFGFGFPSYRIPRIQITPQLGMHKLKLTLPADETEVDSPVVDYSQDKVISWGASASATVLLKQYLWAKPFYNYSLGGKSFSLREATARIWFLGVDLFWLWRSFPPTFAIHGFYEYQSIKFMKVETNQFQNSEVDIGLGFVGLGASFLW